jgi:hypothetical protein
VLKGAPLSSVTGTRTISTRDRNLSERRELALASSHNGCNPGSEVVERYEERHGERSGLLERRQFGLSCHRCRWLLVIRGGGRLVCAHHESHISVRS